MRTARAIAVAALLASGLASYPVRAAGLTAAEVAPREAELRDSFQILAQLIPDARADGRVYRWLDSFSLSAVSYNQTVDRVLGYAKLPLSQVPIDYSTPDANLQCGGSLNVPANQRVAGYVMRGTGVIHLCGAAFLSQDPRALAHVILHEFVHIQGLVDECDAEATAYLTFASAGVPTSRPSYLERCRSFRDLIAEIEDTSDLRNLRNRSFRFSPTVGGGFGQCSFEDPAYPKRAKADSKLARLKLVRVDTSIPGATRVQFQDPQGQWVSLKCGARSRVTTDDLGELGVELFD